MSSKITACIFDLDGVLVNTAIYHYQAWRRLANQLGFDFSEQQNEQLKGISRMDSLNKILGWGKLVKTNAEKENLANQKNQWYVELISNMTPAEVLPGVLGFLGQIKAGGYQIALGSASKNTKIILERTQLSHFFNAVVDGNMVSKSKPDPEVFLKGAALLHTQPEQCIVFEDAEAGIEAGKRGGMKTIGIGNAAILKRADLVVSGIDQLTLADLAKL